MALHRSSGVLMHISSLYGSDSIGSFGTEAKEFIDFLADCGFTWWQVLPFCMSDEYNSPYKSFSAFGGNPYFIDIRCLRDDGLLTAAEIKTVQEKTPYSAEYEFLYRTRLDLLRLAADRTDTAERSRIDAFLADNPYVAQFCDFMARRRANGDLPWYRWRDLAARDEREYAAWSFIQYRFWSQWQTVHTYAANQGVKILGDMPIYVSYDSCDVFANRSQFQLDETGAPTAVAGCPPDYFAKDGQLWGNPLYDWNRMEQDGYAWWRARMRHMLSVFDGVRIDHFRGLESYWSIPACAETAREGHWEPGPGMPLVQALWEVAEEIRQKTGRTVTVLAEDLGESTDALRRFVKDSGFPGMRVMQFAFDADPANIHLPYNYGHNCVAYTGTHDNNTLLGFIWEADPATRCRIAILRLHRDRLELPRGVSGGDPDAFCLYRILGDTADSGYAWFWRGHAHEHPRQSRRKLAVPYHAGTACRYRSGVLPGTQHDVWTLSVLHMCNRKVGSLMKFKTSLKRMTAAVLSVLLLCGGLSACTTGWSGSETTGTTGESGTGTPATDTVTAPADSDTGRETVDPETETDPAPDSLTLVGNGVTTGIVYDADHADCRYAAYTLRDSLKALYGAELSVIRSSEDAGNGVRIVLRNGEAAEETGDCGFTVKAEGQVLVVTAPSLAGFDGAFRRILLDGAGEERLSVPLTYSVAEVVNSGAGYSFDADDFNPEYSSAPFYNDKADSVAYVCNAMWHMFGAIDDGQSLVYRFGNEPTYYEWMSEKIMWSGNAGYINELKGKIQTFPQTQNGYMWSWSTYPYWQVSDTYCIHYDGTFRYIAAVYDIISWENSVEFLNAVDNNTAGGEYAETDASKGRTVLEKVEAAWNYIYYSLKGEEGLIRLTEDSVFLTADGSSRFDYVKATGKTCWNNTGLPRSAASNYWDNLCFGNLDAYESALFYEATQAMIGIYGMLGGEYLDRIPALTELSKTIHNLYDSTFWSDTTGRYIACIDVNGNAVDYGFTFLNFEALKYGLGDAARAQSVFSWVDGTRTVEGDTRTGEEVMSYLTMMRKTAQYRRMKSDAPDLRLAAVTNTLAINNRENQKTGQVWWHGPAGIDPFGSAAYGAHCENGGYIFYPVFYELMARVRYQGAQAVTDRYAQIARVYEFNRLKTDDMVPGSTNWLEGVIGEFPESGLVPTAYIYGLMGVSAEPDGLHVVPSFNETYEMMGVASMTYGGHAYGLEENRNGALTVTCLDGTLAVKLCYQPPRFTAFTVTLYAKDGTSSTYEAMVDGSGMLRLDLTGESIDRVEILPKLS